MCVSVCVVCIYAYMLGNELIFNYQYLRMYKIILYGFVTFPPYSHPYVIMIMPVVSGDVCK